MFKPIIKYQNNSMKLLILPQNGMNDCLAIFEVEEITGKHFLVSIIDTIFIKNLIFCNNNNFRIHQNLI